MTQKTDPQRDDPADDALFRERVREVSEQFDVALGRPDRVAEACAAIAALLPNPPPPRRLGWLLPLVPFLHRRSGEIAWHLFELLDGAVFHAADPLPFLRGMIDAREGALARRALERTVERISEGAAPPAPELLDGLADRVEEADSPFADGESLERIGRILARLPVAGGGDPDKAALALFLRGPSRKIRRLAARVLDREGKPADEETARTLLGAEAAAFLQPYLAFTRASHRDLLHIAPEGKGPPPILESLRGAEEACRRPLLREVIAELGWSRVNLGLEARPVIGVSVGGSFPLMVSPAEANLFDGCEGARRISGLILILAHGGRRDGRRPAREEADPVERFRSVNLAHAEVLADILDVAPLTREKVLRILERMDRIVEDYVYLFSGHDEECERLPEIYAALHAAVLAETGREPDGPSLSAETTRLVQSFEEPRSAGEVRTLHGLKRYLHQRGLRFGFRLVEKGRATHRTVDLVLASPRRVSRVFRVIRYADFDPEERDEQGPERIPYPVRLVAEGFGRQALHGQENLPDVKVFLYGNEVQYYIAYGTHPAFLRIDYAPPHRGGMIDLEFYGVSKNEIAQHPNPSLGALRLFFRRLEYDVRIEETRIHARYDKERAVDLGDLCGKAEALFRLVPYLMELDWVIGSLDLPEEARRRVAVSWADSFAIWGVLPLRELLSRDRTGILVGVESGPEGEREILWDGRGPYRDRFREPPPGCVLSGIPRALESLGLEATPIPEEEAERPVGQIGLESALLEPLRRAVACGEIEERLEAFRRRPETHFRREHETERFARILADKDRVVAEAADLARLVADLGRTLRFRTTGSLNGYEVQRARLALRGPSLEIYVLRDGGGVSRLAFFTRGPCLFLHREKGRGQWRSNASTDRAELHRVLRSNDYPVIDEEAAGKDDRETAARKRERFRAPNPARRPRPAPGERVLAGLRASPGRAAGFALFGVEGRDPRDLDGAVLVAPTVRPEDNTYLYHAAAIVSTGGGALSHAGLIAIQFRKPALIISGEWERDSEEGAAALRYRTLEFEDEFRDVEGYRAAIRRRVRERSHLLREGDLVVVDAEEGTLRVLGRGSDVTALHESFLRFGEACRLLSGATDEEEILRLRGDRLRARHGIEKILVRLEDPALARHAVQELFLNRAFRGEGEGSERAALLETILENRKAGAVAREELERIAREIRERHDAFQDYALHRIPAARSAFEALGLRLDLLALRATLEDTGGAHRLLGAELPPERIDPEPVDRAVRNRLAELRRDWIGRVDEMERAPDHRVGLRHALRKLARIDRVLGVPPEESERFERIAARVDEEDRRTRDRLRERHVLRPADGGFPLSPLFGWKAANLAEMELLLGAAVVPPWFAVTDSAFREALESPLGPAADRVRGITGRPSTLREAIESVSEREDLDRTDRSRLIRSLWEEVELPRDLAREVTEAYRSLFADEASGEGSLPYVAIRSSALEEDAETAARAGEFETFLFVRGGRPLLLHLKRAWSGLWTERAIHNRSVLEIGLDRIGGGVIVQRIVRSRVSGVLQTVNAAERKMGEMVIDAGLGLGEGIVSGTVGADRITVAKEEDLQTGTLRFRYRTGDKREQIVFDRAAGEGTVRTETLYHQRFRPALEYVELCELVRTADRLESAYGYPLDIEFGIEETRLWILQARPVVTFLETLRGTLLGRPLAPPPPSDRKEKSP
ncbi:MAG: hypothetical protein JW958_01260 [Candidatus Eisenbacteria bacterium]|nr:hypothetical protein [Candidatus Eisenbacteria bacterium]